MTTKFGMLSPLRRGARDLEAASGARLFTSKVKQVLLTDPGELPWRTSFGAGVGRLRHESNDAVLRELARVSIRDALARWMRGARITRLEAGHDREALLLSLAVHDPDASEAVDLDAFA